MLHPGAERKREALVRILAAVRFHDRELDEEQRQHREDCRLHQPHERLERHEWHRQHIGYEKPHDRQEHLSGKDVAEEAERERDEARKLGDELDEPDDEAQRRAEIEEFPCVLQRTNDHDAGYLYGEDGDDSERKRHVEVGIDRTQEWHCLIALMHDDAAEERDEVEQVREADEEEYRDDEREETHSERSGAEYLLHVAEHVIEEYLQEVLHLPRYELGVAADRERDNDKNGHHHPLRDESVRHGNTEERKKALCGERYVQTAVHNFTHDTRKVDYAQNERSMGYTKAMAYVTLLLVFAALLGGGLSYEANAALPGDPLYAYKVGVNEKIERALAHTDTATANWDLLVLKERLEEAQTLAKQGRLDAKAQTDVTQNINLHVKNLTAAVDRFQAQGEFQNASQTITRLYDTLDEETQKVYDLSAQGSPTAQFALAPVLVKLRTTLNTVSLISTKVHEQALNASPGHSASTENISAAAEESFFK